MQQLELDQREQQQRQEWTQQEFLEEDGRREACLGGPLLDLQRACPDGLVVQR